MFNFDTIVSLITELYGHNFTVQCSTAVTASIYKDAKSGAWDDGWSSNRRIQLAEVRCYFAQFFSKDELREAGAVF